MSLRPVTRWEYMKLGYRDGWGTECIPGVFGDHEIAMLNSLGEQGWEVVPPWGTMFCLLRREMREEGEEARPARPPC